MGDRLLWFFRNTDCSARPPPLARRKRRFGDRWTWPVKKLDNLLSRDATQRASKACPDIVEEDVQKRHQRLCRLVDSWIRLKTPVLRGAWSHEVVTGRPELSRPSRQSHDGPTVSDSLIAPQPVGITRNGLANRRPPARPPPDHPRGPTRGGLEAQPRWPARQAPPRRPALSAHWSRGGAPTRCFRLLPCVPERRGPVLSPKSVRALCS